MLYQLCPKLVALPTLTRIRSSQSSAPGLPAQVKPLTDGKAGFLTRDNSGTGMVCPGNNVFAQGGRHEPADAQNTLDEVVDPVERPARRAAHDRDRSPAALNGVPVLMDNLGRRIPARLDAQGRDGEADLHPLGPRRAFGAYPEFGARRFLDVGLEFLGRALHFERSARRNDDAGARLAI